jgi:hypothetical protein
MQARMQRGGRARRARDPLGAADAVVGGATAVPVRHTLAPEVHRVLRHLVPWCSDSLRPPRKRRGNDVSPQGQTIRHSPRITVSGSTPRARRIGTRHAATATSAITADTAANVAGSDGFTP